MNAARNKKQKTRRVPSMSHLVPPPQRVFCNRKLRLSRIQAIGFDMDHTLAIYKGPEIESLAYKLTIDKMVERGYPERLRELRYLSDLAIRGLVVDKAHGNLIKLDRYKYVVEAFHGTKRMTYDERKAAYSNRRLDLALADFQNLDTLFTIPEAVLFAQMVDMVERGEPGCRWDFRELFDDIRESIDQAHRDGSLKTIVMADLPRFFEVDPLLAETLTRMRKAGKKVFLLTNSGRDYTEAVMRYILPLGEDRTSWHEYFDVIVVAARKPTFFLEGTPFTMETVHGHKIVTGGNVERLEALLGVSGEKVLYFGDHTFGDIMRSKKYSLWRTAMICEELAHEVRVAERTKRQRSRLERLYITKSSLQDRIAVEQERLDVVRARKLDARGKIHDQAELKRVDESLRKHERRLRKLDGQLTKNLTKIRELEGEIDEEFNVFWGSLFRAGTEKSRVGDQIEDFACVYTARVSNFLHYPVNKYFISPRERMVHEL
jgi:HAD superfamily 5'-nucleotidase-like hydrolase